jgi:hypothetical protein
MPREVGLFRAGRELDSASKVALVEERRKPRRVLSILAGNGQLGTRFERVIHLPRGNKAQRRPPSALPVGMAGTAGGEEMARALREFSTIHLDARRDELVQCAKVGN